MTMHNPPHPGEFLWATYLEPFAISVRSLAKSLGVNPGEADPAEAPVRAASPARGAPDGAGPA